MAVYRTSRNIEASIIQFIEAELVLQGWNDIKVEKTFAKVYGGKPPVVCVRLSDTDHDRTGIGETTTTRSPLVLLDIFATSDGQRLDLKDCLVSVIKLGIPYYEYQTTGSAITSKIASGRMRILNIEDTEVNLSVDKSALAVMDRYRHLLSLKINLGKVE